MLNLYPCLIEMQRGDVSGRPTVPGCLMIKSILLFCYRLQVKSTRNKNGLNQSEMTIAGSYVIILCEWFTKIPIWKFLGGKWSNYWTCSDKNLRDCITSCKMFSPNRAKLKDTKGLSPVRWSSSFCFIVICSSQALILHSISSFSAFSTRNFSARGFCK